MKGPFRIAFIGVFLLFAFSLSQSISTMIALSRSVVERDGAERPRSLHIAVFLPGQSTLFFQQIREGVVSAAPRYDLAVTFHPIGPDSGEFAHARYSGIDGAIIYPYLSESDMLVRLEELDSMGIPVVLVEQDVADDWPWTFVGTNNFEMGRRIGLRLAESGDNQRIVVVYSDKSPAVAAEKELIELGITSVMGAQLAEPIMRRQTTTNPLDAEALTYRLLRAEPPVTSLVFTDSDDTLAALQAIIDLNLVGQVQVIGFGVTEAILDYVDRGILNAAIAVNPQRIGIEAVRVLAELIETGNAPAYIDTGVEIIRGQL